MDFKRMVSRGIPSYVSELVKMLHNIVAKILGDKLAKSQTTSLNKIFEELAAVDNKRAISLADKVDLIPSFLEIVSFFYTNCGATQVNVAPLIEAIGKFSDVVVEFLSNFARQDLFVELATQVLEVYGRQRLLHDFFNKAEYAALREQLASRYLPARPGDIVHKTGVVIKRGNKRNVSVPRLYTFFTHRLPDGTTKLLLSHIGEKKLKEVDLSGCLLVVPADKEICLFGQKQAHFLQMFDRRTHADWVTTFTSVGINKSILMPPGFEAESWTTQLTHFSLDEMMDKAVKQSVRRRDGTKAKQHVKKRNAYIEQNMEAARDKEANVYMCAVFGSPLSGAMALIREVVKQHGDDSHESSAFLPAIRKAVWNNFALLVNTHGNPEEFPFDVHEVFATDAPPDVDLKLASKVVSVLWRSATLQAAFNRRRQEFMPNLEFYLDKADAMFDDDYTLTDDDYRRCPLSYVGSSVERYRFAVDDVQFQFLHAQTNLRNKVLLTFDKMACFVWIVSLSDYDRPDEKTGKPHIMQDREDFFRVSSLAPFASIPVLCLLNRKQQFINKLAKPENLKNFQNLYFFKPLDGNPTPEKCLTFVETLYESNSTTRECKVQAVVSVDTAVSALVDMARGSKFATRLNHYGFS